MQNSKWPEAIAVCAVATSAALILVPWERVGYINWNALSALGTLATAIVAVAVPAWQNRQTKRAQMLRQVEIDWAAAHRAKWLLIDLRNAVTAWAKNNDQDPEVGQMSRIADQAESLMIQTSDVYGLGVLTLIAKLGRELAERNTLGRYVRRVSRHPFGMSGVIEEVSPTYLLELERRLNQLAKDGTSWVALVMKRFAELNTVPPELVGSRRE
ncbi:hypothetical protein GCM10008164_00760 [Achromobacter xylosoxidans]|nr:hypothetical protein GCM10008164_00760 [Achromobacter xylosoxidans]